MYLEDVLECIAWAFAQTENADAHWTLRKLNKAVHGLPTMDAPPEKKKKPRQRGRADGATERLS